MRKPATTVDWDLAKSLVIRGVPMPEVAKQLCCNYSALRSRSSRENWKVTAAVASDLMGQSATRTMQSRGELWGNRVADLLEKHLAYLESLPPEDITLAELDQTTKILERIDGMGRRTLGLDNAQSGPRLITGPVIDVSYPAPARLPESTSPDPAQDKPSA